VSERKREGPEITVVEESPTGSPVTVKILLALGGFAALAIALEGARTWSWWASAVLTSWRFGGTPAVPELFVYPAFFTMVLALSRPAPRVVTARFLTIGLLWSAGLFLADPALRMAIQAITPEAADTLAATTVRGTLLYGLLFAWMYLTFRHLIPRGRGPLAMPEAEAKPGNVKERADGDRPGQADPQRTRPN